MLKTCDLRQKTVINVKSAEKLGCIEDIDIDFETGYIKNVLVPKSRFFFLKRDDYIIPWSNIILIGREIILIDFTENDIIK